MPPPEFRLDEAVADVYGDLRPAAVLRRLLRHTGRLTGSTAGSVSLIDAGHGRYFKVAEYGASCRLGHSFPLDEGATGRAFASRRPGGVAGNFFVIKAVGAASEQGAEMDELLRIGRKVNDVTRTLGVALTACTPPAEGSPLFDLGADEIEFGVGIHGEPGRERRKIKEADAIVDDMLEAVAGPQLCQRVLHLIGHGRRVADVGAAGRRDRQPARGTGRGSRPRLLVTMDVR